MLKIISDGINHKIIGADGKMLTNVASITIDEILPDQPITATVVLINVGLDITTANVIQEHFKLIPPKD
jgi:hypothetical protein